uniref:Zinc finger MYM-type protein 1 n=1 Tax=Schizaphis graminum TaxID=13262 RepID=A0A2S2PGV1_SCHGA
MNPVRDVVVMLLETPFPRWKSDSKKDLLKVGKPIPMLLKSVPDKKQAKVYCRSFNTNLYQQHSWLCGSHYMQKLFCWPCLLIGKNKSVWNTVGYCDLKNVTRTVQIHKSSKEHIHNHLGLKSLEKDIFNVVDIVNEHDYLFKKNYNENVRLNRLFMEHLIDLVLFLGKQELAFCDHDNSNDSLNKGNFRELFNMHINRCSQEVQNHYKSIKNIFTGFSESIQNDLISCISESLINQIINEISQCKFYSIQVDDSTNINQKTQCSVIIRYVTDKSQLVERFMGFHVSEDRTAQGLLNLVNSVLHEFDLKNKLIAQCYDGACVVPEHLIDLQAIIKDIAPNALFTHCLTHKLNFVLQHGCNTIAKCRIFFANLTGIAAYFHNSTSRTNVVDNILGKQNPQFIQTRWFSRSKILYSIVNDWSGFINVFDYISNDPKSSPESICGAIGHLKNLKSFEFTFLALIFSNIFICTDNLFNILQNKPFDIEFCLKNINTTCDLINKKKNKSEFLKLFNQAVTLTKPPKATSNESNIQLNFRILFYEIIDNILMQLYTRFENISKLLFLQLADVTQFREYSFKFPENALNNLKSTYSNIFPDINKLKVELEVLYYNVKYHNLLHIYDMVKIIEQDALKDILPEVYKLFTLILTIPSTNVSNERNFSCLKRIKTFSQNSISQLHSSSIAILSIEKSLIQQLKETESFYDNIINIYAGRKDRSINLTYKT